jgi:hypothetical protein
MGAHNGCLTHAPDEQDLKQNGNDDKSNDNNNGNKASHKLKQHRTFVRPFMNRFSLASNSTNSQEIIVDEDNDDTALQKQQKKNNNNRHHSRHKHHHHHHHGHHRHHRHHSGHHSSHHSHHSRHHSHRPKQEIKVLFLDVDGVLNGEDVAGGYSGVNNDLIMLLKQIIEETNCKIVLSSTWRLNPAARNYLLHFLKSRADINVEDIIIGDTPRIPNVPRSDEIEKFLNGHRFRRHNTVITWCAIDDMPLKAQRPEFMSDHFVQTNYRTGLSLSNTYRVIDILNNNINRNDVNIIKNQTLAQTPTTTTTETSNHRTTTNAVIDWLF